MATWHILTYKRKIDLQFHTTRRLIPMLIPLQLTESNRTYSLNF